ncbi:MAG: methyltransferase domain-containing protein [Limisphaerales bacterium]
MSSSYTERFQQKDEVSSYDEAEYRAESYASWMWRLQRPVLERLVKEFRASQSKPVRLLDFACGTGRVISVLEQLVDASDGVDISENMVAVARGRCSKARLLVGNVLTEPELLQPSYDLISCFRFVLNAEPELRRRILQRLRQGLRSPGGLLLINMHGNSRSLRHPAIVWRRGREGAKGDVMLNEMSPVEMERLLETSGFEIVRRFGFGMLPPTLYRTPLRRVAGAVDRSLAGEHFWNGWAIDILYLCRPV